MQGIILLMKQDKFITKKKNNRKGIYGNATNNEINELKNEGIEVQTIPWINDKEN